MKLSTLIRHIKDYQYGEYGNDLIGKIRLVDSDTIELETIINGCGWDFITNDEWSFTKRFSYEILEV